MKARNRIRLVVATTALFTSSCSHAGKLPDPASYVFYGIDPQAGKLLGHTPDKDLPLSRCQADDVSKGKCVVLFTEEYDRLLNDYAFVEQDDESCHNPQPKAKP